MLVLNQSEGNSTTATLGDVEIEVKVLEIRGSSVRLGWSAPKEVRIKRDDAKKQAAEAA